MLRFLSRRLRNRETTNSSPRASVLDKHQAGGEKLKKTEEENRTTPIVVTASNDDVDIPNRGPRYSFKPDQLKPWPHATNDSKNEYLDDTNESEQAVWDEVFPQQLQCVITTYLDEEKKYASQIILDLIWARKATQERLDSAWKNHTKHVNAVLVAMECSLISKSWREHGQIKGLGENWYDEVIIMICRCISTHPYQAFHVHLKASYSSILVIPEDADARETCAYAVWKAQKSNFEGRRFVNHTALAGIFTVTNIRRIISYEKDKFRVADNLDWQLLCDRASTSAKQIFAIGIYCRISLSSIYTFIVEDGVSDKQFPLKIEPHSDYQSGRSAIDFGLLHDVQSKFLVHDFKSHKSALIVNLHEDIVVPVMAHKDLDLIGEGAFSMVYRVRVHQDYHDFTENRKDPFALKVSRYSQPSGDFERELQGLQWVHQHPQENLVIHFAAWTQSERFYILLPLASQNLRAFMNSEAGPELSSEFVLWFLTQLRGLASALQHLHLSYAQIEVVDHPTSPATTSIMAGYHHDLKPENILVFRDHKEDRGKFKISDFGSARLGQLHSGVFGGSEGSATRPSAFGGGTVTYEAPDIVLNHKASRPADMWSLGCIFLELLLWAFSAGKSDINNKFAFERIQELVEYPYVSTDSFWYKGEDGVGRLKSAVIKAMDGVKKASRGRRAFDGLVSCIEDLLIIEPRKRLTAIGLTQRLNVMFAQARADLEEDPNCYLHGNSISSSRIPSIDSRSVEVTDLEVSVPAISVRRPSFEVHPGTHGILEDLPDSDFSLEETPHLPPGDTSSGSAQKIFVGTPTTGIPKNHP